MKASRYSLFQLMIMASLGTACVIVKIALKMPLKMPGHNGLFWTAIILVSSAIVPKKGSALITGLFGAAIAAFVSPGGSGPVVAFLSFSATAIGIELGLLLSARVAPRPMRFFVAGLLGAWGKLIVKMGVDLSMGVPLAAVIVRRSYATLSYSLFGIAGALLGLLVVIALEKASMKAYLQERR